MVLDKTTAINQENSKGKDCLSYLGKILIFLKARSNLKAEVGRGEHLRKMLRISVGSEFLRVCSW